MSLKPQAGTRSTRGLTLKRLPSSNAGMSPCPRRGRHVRMVTYPVGSVPCEFQHVLCPLRLPAASMSPEWRVSCDDRVPIWWAGTCVFLPEVGGSASPV